jgi:hypothetical protein
VKRASPKLVKQTGQAGPRWKPMQNASFQGEQPTGRGFVGVFVNDWYQVTMYEDAGPDGAVNWLVIRRRDSAPVHDWRHLQQIKNDLCGPEREGIEIYPAESRLVDTANQYHMYVFPSGARVPFGYLEREVSDAPHEGNRNRPFADPPKDLNAKVAEITRETGVLFGGSREAK